MLPGTYRACLYGPLPSGHVDESCFEWIDIPMEPLEEGEYLAKTECLTMTPANRKHWHEDLIVSSSSIAKIIESKNPDFPVGKYLYSFAGWTEYVHSGYKPRREVVTVPVPPKSVDPAPGLPVSILTHMLGASGMTAYFGLYDVGEPRPGETIVVAGASGNIGMLVCQMAKMSGLEVIGIAGGEMKCNWLMDNLGIDAVIDYKSDDVEKRMAELCPDGMDIFFDNVGGEVLNAAMANMAKGCRVVVCGETSQMELEGATLKKDVPSTLSQEGPSNYFNLVYAEAEMRGLYVMKYASQFPQVMKWLAGKYASGEFIYKEDRAFEGLENAPKMMMRMMAGENFGSSVLQL